MRLTRAYTNGPADLEDCFQEVCLQIWQSRSRFEGRSNWSTWVYRITLNVCLTRLKKAKAGKKAEAEAAGDMYIPDATEAMEQGAEIEALYRAIRQLSETDRAIILLYLEERQYSEIADILGSNTSAIGARINRIKTRLGHILSEGNNHD